MALLVMLWGLDVPAGCEELSGGGVVWLPQLLAPSRKTANDNSLLIVSGVNATVDVGLP